MAQVLGLLVLVQSSFHCIVLKMYTFFSKTGGEPSRLEKEQIICLSIVVLHWVSDLSSIKMWEKIRVGWFGRIELKQVYYHMWNRSPVQVRCMRQGALGLVHWNDPEGWDGEGGERGVQDGNTCTPMADSCWCMAKPIVKFKKLNK